MADLSQTIQVIFEGVDDLTGSIDSISSGLQDFSGQAQNVTGPLADVATGLLAFEAAAAAGAIAMASIATVAAGQFGDSFNEISTLTNASNEELGKFRGQLLDYAGESSFAFSQITDSTYAAISAGIDYGESIAFIANAERLAIASKADLSDTTVLLASTLNAFGEKADQAARYSDVLFTTVRLGQTTLPELASSLAQISSTANAAGVPIETLAAAVADLTAKGLPTSQAITGLKAALSNIIKPSTEAGKAAAELGVAFGLQALESQGLEGLLQSLSDATGGNADQMARFFGSTEALNAVMALTQDGAAGLTSKLAEMQNATGAVTAAYDKMADNFELVNQRIGNSITKFLVEAGTPLEDRWAEIGKAVSDVFLSMSDAVKEGAFDDIYAALNAFADETIKALQALAANLPDVLAGLEFTGFLDSLKGLGAAIGGIFEGADLTTVDGLTAAMQGVIDVGAGLINVTSGIVDGLTPMIRTLADAGQEFGRMSPEAQNAAGVVLGMATAVDKLLGFLDVATPALATIAGAFVTIAGSTVANTVRAIGVSMGTAGLAGAATTAQAALGPLLAFFAGAALGNAISEFTGVAGAIETLGDKALDALYGLEAADTAIARLPTNLERVSQTTGMAVTSLDAFNQLANSGAIVFDTVSNTWLSAADAAGRLDVSIAGMGDSADGVDRSLDAAGSAARGFGSQASDAQRDSDDLRRSLEQIASNERIKNMEFQMRLDIAEVEANADIAIAALDGLGTTIKSTGDLLGTLFGLLADPEISGYDRSKILDQIDAEARARAEALALQRELTQAQIDYMQARSDALANNQGIITIDGAGLQPHLEAFMWEILRTLQVRVNEDGLEFLVGV